MKFSHQRWRDRRVCGQPRRRKILDPAGASWSRASPENSGLSPAGAPLQRLVLLRSGHNELGRDSGCRAPNERATAASVSRSGEAIHTTERLARRWLEVMTRAVWEAGLCPLLTQHAKMGIAHAVPTARGSLSGGPLCGMPRVDFATEIPQSRTR